MSSSSPEKEYSEATILSSIDIELDTVRRLYESEKQRNQEVGKEMNNLAQKVLKSQSDTKYWQDKCINLQVDLSIAQFDLKQYQDEKIVKDIKDLKLTKEKLSEVEDQVKHLVEAHKFELEQWEKEYQESLKEKEDIIERIRDVVDRLNDKLDEQKTEEKIIDNILSLPDNNSMMRFVYTAQFKVNQKILSDIAQNKKKEEWRSAELMQQPMQFNPMMMFPQPPMHFPQMPNPMIFKRSDAPVTTPDPASTTVVAPSEPPTQEKKMERED